MADFTKIRDPLCEALSYISDINDVLNLITAGGEFASLTPGCIQNIISKKYVYKSLRQFANFIELETFNDKILLQIPQEEDIKIISTLPKLKKTNLVLTKYFENFDEFMKEAMLVIDEFSSISTIFIRILGFLRKTNIIGIQLQNGRVHLINSLSHYYTDYLNKQLDYLREKGIHTIFYREKYTPVIFPITLPKIYKEKISRHEPVESLRSAMINFLSNINFDSVLREKLGLSISLNEKIRPIIETGTADLFQLRKILQIYISLNFKNIGKSREKILVADDLFEKYFYKYNIDPDNFTNDDLHNLENENLYDYNFMDVHDILSWNIPIRAIQENEIRDLQNSIDIIRNACRILNICLGLP